MPERFGGRIRDSAKTASRLIKGAVEWIWSVVIVPSDPQEPVAHRKEPGWTMDQVIAAMWEDPIAIEVVHKLTRWAAERQLRVTGTTTQAPALGWHLHARGTDYELFQADSRRAKSQASVLWLPMHRLKSKPVLDEPARRAAFIEALSVCFEIPRNRTDKRPSIPMAELADGYAFHVFTSAWEVVIDDVHSSPRRSPTT